MAESEAPPANQPELSERDQATMEAMKIVNTPVDESEQTVPDLLKQYRDLMHEKGLDWLWEKLDLASGGEASKPAEVPADPNPPPSEVPL